MNWLFSAQSIITYHWQVIVFPTNSHASLTVCPTCAWSWPSALGVEVDEWGLHCVKSQITWKTGLNWTIPELTNDKLEEKSWWPSWNLKSKNPHFCLPWVVLGQYRRGFQNCMRYAGVRCHPTQKLLSNLKYPCSDSILPSFCVQRKANLWGRGVTPGCLSF